MGVSWLNITEATNSFDFVSESSRVPTYSAHVSSLADALCTNTPPAPPLTLGIVPMVLPPIPRISMVSVVGWPTILLTGLAMMMASYVAQIEAPTDEKWFIFVCLVVKIKGCYV